MKQISLLLLFVFISLSLNAKEPLLELLAKDVPSNVLWLVTDNPTQKIVLKRFKQPDLKEDNKHYYALNDFKYSLAITYDNSKMISAINYKVHKASLRMSDFISQINKKQFHLFPESGHEKGRYFAALIPNLGIRLIFRNNSKKKLYKVQFNNKWKSNK